MTSKQIKIALIATLVFSFLIRIIHILYDLPMLNIADEAGSGIYGTLNMLMSKSIIIPLGSYVNYSGLTSYIYMPFAIIWALILLIKNGSIEAVQNATILDNAAWFMTIGRFVSMLAGTVTIYFVFKITKKYIGEKWGLLAAILAGLNLIFLIETVFGRPWGLCAMFFTIAIYFLYGGKTQESELINQGKKNVLLIGLFCGLAYAVHQAGAFLFLPTFLLSIYKYGKRALWSVLPFSAMVVLITILHPDSIAQNLGLLGKTVGGENLSYFGISILERFTIYPEILIKYFPLQLVLIITAFVLRKIKNKETKELLLLCFGYYFIIGPILGTEITRYLTPIMPLFAILTVDSLKSISDQMNKSARNILIIFVILATTWSPLFWSIAMTKESTLTQARNWVQENIKDGEWIVVEETDLNLLPSLATIDLIRNYESTYYMRREKLIEAMYAENKISGKSYNYINLYMFEGYEEELMANLKGYLLKYENTYGSAEPIASFKSEKGDDSVAISIVDNKSYEFIPSIYLPSLLRSGPNINIYTLN